MLRLDVPLEILLSHPPRALVGRGWYNVDHRDHCDQAGSSSCKLDAFEEEIGERHSENRCSGCPWLLVVIGDFEVGGFDCRYFEKFAVGSAWVGRRRQLEGEHIYIARSSTVLSLFTVKRSLRYHCAKHLCHFHTVDSQCS